MAKTKESTAMTPSERAVVALGSSAREQNLVELAKRSTEISTITNKDGYTQCHAARIVLRDERISIEKQGKEARDDATKFSKAVIAEELRLIGIIEAEEKRLQGIEDEWNAIEEAKRKAEADRIANLQSQIEVIKMSAVKVAGRSAKEIAERLAEVRAIACSTFEEFADFAMEARENAIFALDQLLAGAKAQEEAAAVAAAKIAEDQRELSRLRAEEEARKKQEAARLAEETRLREEQEAACRARIEAEERAARERIEQEQRAAREAQERTQAALSEIQSIQQQVMIASIGRPGVRAGGTVQCVKETLAETEKWAIDPERFGVLTEAANQAKAQAIQSIKSLLDQAIQREADEAKARQEAAARAEEERKLQLERDALAEKERELKRQADELLDGETMLAKFIERFGNRREFADVVMAIQNHQMKKAA